MRKYSPPDAYAFLYAAGEIDTGDISARQFERCGNELIRLSRMNGSYEKLPVSFRASMREMLQTPCDMSTAQKLGDIGLKMVNLETLDETEAKEVRTYFSALSRVWPLRAGVLNVGQE